jgi:hypothetical protein
MVVKQEDSDHTSSLTQSAGWIKDFRPGYRGASGTRVADVRH